jgi:hypothetical protein
LQGLSNAWTAGDRYAIKIAQVIARNALRAEARPGADWEDAVNQIDWLDWLDTCAKRALGESHVLQPQKISR